MAYNNISKTREGARVLSKEADYLQYDTYGKLPLIGGKRSIGEPNIDQTKRGVLYGNVQSAIDDLYTLIEQIPINGVVTMTEDAPPIAVQQVESVSFDGIVQNIDSDQEQAVVHVYGFPFIFDNGTNAATVCETAYNKFTEFVAAEKYFAEVNRKGVDGTILECRFIDSVSHPATNISENGIRQIGTIDVAAKSGYGSWVKLGSGFLPNVTPQVTVYYFKRIA